ncbi:MauE/DoxX family redox-associated membrane protein [Amycolatopsis oliviviridis]|nr:MauE/DoxX family redox-associated membrane protein [Amycolatopsis oliviviridis]
MNKTVILVARYVVAAVFLAYGGLKLAGGQYYYGDWSMTKDTVRGPGLVWAFYGYSPVYGRITGLFEFLPALLLLFRRTTLLGAMALFAVGLNVTVMDFAFGFPLPACLLVLTCTLLCGLILAGDLPRLRKVFWDRPAAKPEAVPPAGP